MCNATQWIALFLFLCRLSTAALTPSDIPRVKSDQFRSEGLFEGGALTPANLEKLRLAEHKKEGFERWVIDFSSATNRAVGTAAPRFQLQYFKSEHVQKEDGTEGITKPAKFLFLFRAIQQNYLAADQMKKLARSSRYVEDILLYPPIEQGDMAMEFVLKKDVLFEPHQPVEKEGRVVLDLKAAP